MDFRIVKHELKFKEPGGTSRGTLYSKPSWFLHAFDEKDHYGECSIIEGLSPDDLRLLPAKLEKVAELYRQGLSIDPSEFVYFPALRFAIETLQKDLDAGGTKRLFESAFLHGRGIAINGLVWMGDKSDMLEQIKDKIKSGHRCIKIKIAAIDFFDEIDMIALIREQFNKEEIQIRLDANGGFDIDNALEKLKRLSEYDIHSVEQPIKAGNWYEMASIVSNSPVDIALDEELIGIHDPYKRESLIDTIQPHYLIIKPSILGGFRASEEWIQLADKFGTDYWVTSALESNVGLNAIAQWTATLDNKLYQGLGTGQVFTNNIASPLFVESGHLFYGSSPWKFDILN